MEWLKLAGTKIATLLISKKFWGVVIAMVGYWFAHTGAWTPEQVQVLFAPLLAFVAGEFALDWKRIETDSELVKSIESKVDAAIASGLNKLGSKSEPKPEVAPVNVNEPAPATGPAEKEVVAVTSDGRKVIGVKKD